MLLYLGQVFSSLPVEVSVHRKRIDQRVILTVAAIAVVSALIIGCSTRPEVSETLPMSGNHSPGDLFMVTADTSSDGYHYLEPQMSPDNSRIVFTADWSALPTTSHPPEIAPLIRQIIVIDAVPQDSPLISLGLSGAKLVRINAGGELMDIQKGTPSWINDQSILFWIETSNGARLARVDLPNPVPEGMMLQPEILFNEPEDSNPAAYQFYEHREPALSPDGRWIAFSKFGYIIDGYPIPVTGQSIWIMEMPQPGSQSEIVFQVTAEAAVATEPSWSPDGSMLVFQATTDITGAPELGPKEIFTVDFDTTGYAQNDIVLNRNLNRLTNSEDNNGSPIGVRNQSPVFSPDGQNIMFISDRRAPSITLREKSVWSIPSDGGLEPSILFFSRYDDVDVTFAPGLNNRIIISSAMGYPTEMLDIIEQEAFIQIMEEDPGITIVQATSQAAAIRTELEFFEGVMSHIMVFSNWD